MSENEYKVAGYSFSDLHDYKEAVRELETVEYIKANTNLDDLNKSVKLYHKLVERKTLKTVIGFAFLKELQERIINEGIINKENIPCIKVEKDAKQIKIDSGQLSRDAEQNQKLMFEDFRVRIRNLKIISAFLTGIILIMIIISIFSSRSRFTEYENKIINKYSSWQEDLNAKQKELNARENKLDEREEAVTETQNQ